MIKHTTFPTIIFITIVVSLFGACTTASTQAPLPEQTAEPTISPAPNFKETRKPELSDSLIRGCQGRRSAGGFDKAGLPEGETAVDFTLKDTVGTTVSLSELLREKPVVMIFGSFT